MTNRKTYESLLVISIGFALIALLKKVLWLGILSGLILIIGLSSSFFRKKLHALWMRLAEVLGYINGKIIFSIFFFVLIVPIALLFKLFRTKEKAITTNFVERNHSYTAEDLKHIF